MLKTFTGSIDEQGVTAEKIVESYRVGKHQSDTHAAASEYSGKSVTHLHACQSEQQEHEQWNTEYEYRHCNHSR